MDRDHNVTSTTSKHIPEHHRRPVSQDYLESSTHHPDLAVVSNVTIHVQPTPAVVPLPTVIHVMKGMEAF